MRATNIIALVKAKHRRALLKQADLHTPGNPQISWTNGVGLICTGSNMNRNIFYIIGVIVVIVIVLKVLGLF